MGCDSFRRSRFGDEETRIQLVVRGACLLGVFAPLRLRVEVPCESFQLSQTSTCQTMKTQSSLQLAPLAPTSSLLILRLASLAMLVLTLLPAAALPDRDCVRRTSRSALESQGASEIQAASLFPRAAAGASHTAALLSVRNPRSPSPAGSPKFLARRLLTPIPSPHRNNSSG